jgi:hypothetical protein
VKKYGIAGHATEGNIIWRMRFWCWISKATNTHLEYVILTVLYTAIKVTKTRLNIQLCVHRLSCLHNTATAVHYLHTCSSTASTVISFLFSEDHKSRNSSLYILVLLVMCIFLDTSILGSVLHSIKSDMRDWEVLTAVSLTFKAFYDTKPFRLVIIYGLSEKQYYHRNNGSYSQKERSKFPEFLNFQARLIEI